MDPIPELVLSISFPGEGNGYLATGSSVLAWPTCIVLSLDHKLLEDCDYDLFIYLLRLKKHVASSQNTLGLRSMFTLQFIERALGSLQLRTGFRGDDLCMML